jgi:hypothetical protein
VRGERSGHWQSTIGLPANPGASGGGSPMGERVGECMHWHVPEESKLSWGEGAETVERRIINKVIVSVSNDHGQRDFQV